MAFLAAGLIIFSRGEVQGLTTGAGMWLASAIGLCCGLGLWQIGIFACFLAMIVLGLLQAVSARIAAADKADPELARSSASASEPADRPALRDQKPALVDVSPEGRTLCRRVW